MVGAIEVNNLSKHYGSFRAVDDIGLSIAAGSFASILGPSGCGKTTTLRMLAGFITPTVGSIRVDGAVVSDKDGVVAPEERDMGMVFQSYAVWPHMTVSDNVAYGLRYGRKREQDARKRKLRVDEVLALVGLDGQQEKLPSALSGGQQQRVALARAMVTEPRILLLDEPLSNLDAKLREGMRLELRRLQKRIGVTTVLVTHSQDEALLLSDQVIIMKSGKVIEAGVPDRLYHRPKTLFVADFLGTVNAFEGRLVERRDGDLAMVETPFGRLTCTAPEEIAVEKFHVVLRPEAIRILDEKSSASIENQILGTVTEVMFGGNLTEYLVTVGDTNLRVQSLSGRPRAVGEDVVLTFSVSDTRLIGGSC
ncbi:ABC transporter ATP-binding protein [Rhizobium sp. TRM96647]|uniref:ABC transporter ATP-binding protein n=1 Tax=unclassified Rhizobium TaxID=2613769 RepID=UPI0021E6E4B2|nr:MULTISPECIES: ABC transporter ATP-binding protein [unclassified Rhizobium]MCV3739223.1 ABC transporter ATP-binding protein [Rhizobium sp. TRM96647]MCV3760899.1 ABC transporter ATP-binding protein [Rhizobium sp. TRM96650]